MLALDLQLAYALLTDGAFADAGASVARSIQTKSSTREQKILLFILRALFLPEFRFSLGADRNCRRSAQLMP